MRESSAVREDGLSVLEASLEATLAQLDSREVADVVIAGLTVEDLIRVVATTPPFSSALAGRIQHHLLTRLG